MLSPIFISQNLSASTKYLSTVDFEYGRVAAALPAQDSSQTENTRTPLSYSTDKELKGDYEQNGDLE